MGRGRGDEVKNLISRAGVTDDSLASLGLDADAIGSDSFDGVSDYGDDDLSNVDALSAVSFGSGGGGGGGGGGSGGGHHKMEADLVRMDLRRAEGELQALHTQSAATIRELQARCAAAEQRAHTAEAAREREASRHDAELARAGEKHAQEMAETLRVRKQEFVDADALAREKSAAMRAAFTPLELSAERYADLKGTPADELPFREWLQVAVHETVAAAAKQLEGARRERDQLQATLAECREAEAQAKREAAQAAGALHAREQVMAKAAKAADDAQTELRREAADAVARVEQVAADAEKYDSTRSKLAKLESQAAGLTRERDDAVAKLDALMSTATNAVALQQQLDLLKMDKMYLTRELDTLKQRLHRAEETADATAPQLEALKTEKQELYDRLLAVREELSSGLDRRVEEELGRLKQRADLDAAAAQSHAREVFERENLALREARDAAREEADRQTVALKQANAANSQLEIDYRTLTATTEAQLSELRNRLRLKSFEHERVAVQLEEVKGLSAQARLEGERWQQKCGVLKEEYYALKTESATRTTSLEARLTQTAKQLEHYEMIEAELDAAIVSGTASTINGGAADVGSTMASSAKRRVQQALGLANQVTSLQTEQKGLVEQLANAQQERKKQAEELEQARAAASSSSQPFSLLASQLEQKDDTIAELRLRCEVAESDVAAARADAAAANGRERELQADLERLLRQRSEVAMLRAELESLAGGEGGLAGAVTAATGDAAAGPSGTLRYGGGGVPEPEGGPVGPVTGGVELPEPQGYYFKKLASAT
jgi:progesterone-induced-blocking factor 1